jgi:HEPN domain-containing protein
MAQAHRLQQAAEKAIKALLIKHGVAFPYVHDMYTISANSCSYSKTLGNLSLK